ncbi:MAG: MBOAT family protein [Clostridia bacterium]|nr:MBOAT family protein [Clostridia bacterium]
MLFSSLIFLLLFLPLFFVCYFASKKLKVRNCIIFLFSLFFYAWGEPLYIFLMLFSLVMNYVLALKMYGKNGRSKKVLALAAVLNLLLLGIFKYTGFLLGTINALPGVSIPVPVIELPIGISFYTFQILSYVIDVYRGECAPQKNLVSLGAYLCAFPQLIAGPIVRYVTVAQELEERCSSADDIAHGIRRFLLGLSKKVLIANTIAEVTDTLFAADFSQLGMFGIWLAVIGYALQIYYDFSGYSDMAIGLGRIMGFHYLENFNDPYAAVSITDFWRRWHISLSTFFRDYVYIPLGGNRVSRGRWVFNLAVVWILTGLWHGASWNFVLWGVYYGALLILEKLFWGERLGKIPVLNRIYTLFLVLIGWVIFRVETISGIGSALLTMFGANGITGAAGILTRSGVDLPYAAAMLIGILFALPIEKKIAPVLADNRAMAVITDCVSVLALFLCVVTLEVGAYNPFIYFRF